ECVMPIENTYPGTARNETSNAGSSAGTLLEKGRNAAADKIAAAAWSIEGHAEQLPGGARVASFAHNAADSLTCTADYIREHDAKAMLEDATQIVKNNP